MLKILPKSEYKDIPSKENPAPKSVYFNLKIVYPCVFAILQGIGYYKILDLTVILEYFWCLLVTQFVWGLIKSAFLASLSELEVGFLKKMMLGAEDMKKVGGIYVKTFNQLYEFSFVTLMNAAFLQYQISLYGQPTAKLLCLTIIWPIYILFGFCYCEQSVLATWEWKQ